MTCLLAARFASQTMNFRKLMSPALTDIIIASRRCINITASLGASRYNDILGVPRDANPKQIKDAYYKLAMKHHPDKNQGTLISLEQFIDIKEAYDVLSKESSRMNYNKNMGSSNNNFISTNWSKTENSHQITKRAGGFDRPFDVFITVIPVPKNIVQTEINNILSSKIKYRVLKWILSHLFLYLWAWGSKNYVYVLIKVSSSSNYPLAEYIRGLLEKQTIKIKLTEMEVIKGKVVEVNIYKNEKVIKVNIPRGVQKKTLSYFLFYLEDKL